MMSEARRAAIRRHYRSLRNAIDKTQRQIEMLAHLRPGRYWNIENGYMWPTAAERVALARVLKVSDSDLPSESFKSFDEERAS